MPESGRKKQLDAFISYRRDNGAGEARLIYEELKKRGLHAYLDVNADDKKPPFEADFLQRIAEARNFLVVLAPNSLDRCAEPRDYLRQEIACAIKTTRHIVPVMLPKFAFPLPSKLPEEIQDLPNYDAATYVHEVFEGSMDKLVKKMQLSPLPIWKTRAFVFALGGLLGVAAVAYFVWHYERTASLQSIKQEEALRQMDALQQQQKQQQQENSLMGDARVAEQGNDLGRAQLDYEKVIGLHGSREVEASASLNAVRQKLSGATDAEIVQRDFTIGAEAYRRGDYAVAKTEMNQVLMRSPQNWPQRVQAADYLRRSESQMQVQQHLKQAQSYLNDKKYDAAQVEARQVVNTQDADPSMVKQAQDLIARIPAPPGSAVLPSQPSPEVEGQIRDAEAFARQGHFKEAWSKAAAIEQSKGDASTVRQTIRTAEDNRFQELSSRYVGSDKQNRAELRDLLAAFQQFLNNTVNKEADASRYVDQIAGEIKALDSSSSSPSATKADPIVTATSDAAAIQQRLNEYAEAVATGDLEKVKAIRELKGNEEKRMVENLRATKGKGYALRNCSLLEVSGENARVSCDAVLTLSNGTPSQPVTFVMKRIYGQWLILSSN
jgi:hypothetical protein